MLTSISARQLPRPLPKQQTIMANNNPPQDQLAQPPPTPPPCRASSLPADGTQEECRCPSCSPEPRGDAFIPRSAIDPSRRIVRARRPPATPNNALPTAATGGVNATSPSVAGGGSPTTSGAINRNVLTNSGTPTSDDTSSDLSGAIGFLRQLNGPETSNNPAPTAATASGANATNIGGGPNQLLNHYLHRGSNNHSSAAVEQGEGKKTNYSCAISSFINSICSFHGLIKSLILSLTIVGLEEQERQIIPESGKKNAL